MITIRRPNRDDVLSIWRVRADAIQTRCRSHYTQYETETWALSPMPDQFDQLIDTKDFRVAEEDGDIVGWGFLDRESGRVEAMFVASDSQGRGIGTTLLSTLEQIARGAGLEVLRLSSTLNALRFYESAGFQAKAKGTYFHSSGLKLDCVHMEKSLE